METFRRGGLTFPVRDSGTVGGTPVILLHGFPQDASAFDAVTPSLVELGMRTLVPTQRGYAATNRPTGRHDYRLLELADDVLALADAAGAEAFHLVGHDWGGGVAWALAAWHPDRVTTLTVLSTPHPAALRWSLLHSDQALKSWYMAFFQLPALPEWVLSHSLEGSLTSSGLPKPLAQRYAAGPAGRLSGGLNWYRALPFSSSPEVGDIHVPTTYIWGEQDFALGRAAAEATASHVTAEYRFLPLPVGHWLPETAAPAVADAISHRVRFAPG